MKKNEDRSVKDTTLLQVRKMYQFDAYNFTMIFSHKWPLHVSDIYMSIFRSSIYVVSLPHVVLCHRCWGCGPAELVCSLVHCLSVNIQLVKWFASSWYVFLTYTCQPLCCSTLGRLDGFAKHAMRTVALGSQHPGFVVTYLVCMLRQFSFSRRLGNNAPYDGTTTKCHRHNLDFRLIRR